MLTEELKKEIYQTLEWKSYPNYPKGGQQVGIGPRGVTLTHKDFDFEISVGSFRTQSQNKEMCMNLFELFLMDFIK